MDKKNYTYKDVFGQKEYVKMMIAALINRFGDSIDVIASTWIVYQLTNSAAWSAIVYAVNTLPTVIVTPLAGAWVEGRNKKKIMIVTDIIRCLCVAFVATSFLLGFLQAWMILCTNLIISTVEAFRDPADTALTPMVLKEELFEYGMSLHSSLARIVSLVGMGSAAGIIAIIGVSGALYIDMATFIISAAIICFVNTKEKLQGKVKFDSKEYLDDLIDGFKYVSKEKVIVYFLMYTVFLNAVLVPINSLQAPMASEILHSGVDVLSILSVAVTIGMLVGSTTYPIISKYLSEKMIAFISGFSIGLYYLALVFGEPFYTSQLRVDCVVAVSSFLIGYCIALAQNLMSIIFMKKVSKEYISRASGVATSVSVAANPLMSLLVGFVVSLISMRTLYISAGLLSFVVVVFLSRNSVLDGKKKKMEESVLQEELAA